MKNLGLLLLMFFGSLSISAQDLNLFFGKADNFLKSNVLNGKVAYSKIHSNPKALNEVLELAKDISVSKKDAENYQAFWINAYNLSVIKGIINDYQTNSPLDNPGFFDKIEYSLGGKKITLNDIEHKLLRAEFNDPRFHFILVCGAVGCPPLISEAYLPHTLDEQMEAQTKKALNGSFLRVNEKKKRVEASQIMEWYNADFTLNGTSEIDFINSFRTQKIPNDFKLSYFPYDWKLNGQ